MKLTPKLKKPVKIPVRAARFTLQYKEEAEKFLFELSNYTGYTRTELMESFVFFAYYIFKEETQNKTKINMFHPILHFKPLNPNKMTTKPQIHLFNPDGSQVSEKLIFTNFSTYQKSFFNTLEEAEQQIKAGAVTGYIYDEKTRRQRFYTNGILSNEKQL